MTIVGNALQRAYERERDAIQAEARRINTQLGQVAVESGQLSQIIRNNPLTPEKWRADSERLTLENERLQAQSVVIKERWEAHLSRWGRFSGEAANRQHNQLN